SSELIRRLRLGELLWRRQPAYVGVCACSTRARSFPRRPAGDPVRQPHRGVVQSAFWYEATMTTTCERIGSWAASLTEADIPEGVRERCELQRASSMAAARAGEREAAPFADVAGKGP